MRRTILVSLLIGIIILLTSCGVSPNQDQRFEKLAGEYIEKSLQMFPETATALGDHRYDDQLNDYSEAGFQAAL